jgi:hypothetical protein
MALLQLPTPETCRWRQPPLADGSTECQLVKVLLGPAIQAECRVSEDTCQACCRSFPSSERRLNPVVAGLLHSISSTLLESSDNGSASDLNRIRTFAEEFLDVEFPRDFTLTPARSVVECAWLGRRLESAGGEDAHECHHPLHSLATPAQCRVCRDWTRRKPVSRFLSLSELVPLPARCCGTKVRDWAVAITTSPRRQTTLEPCLDSVIRAGWETPRIFVDGTHELPKRCSRLNVTCRETPIGAWPAWYLALTELVLQQPAADAYLMLQDDVIFHDRESVRDYLEHVLWPGHRLGVVSLFYSGFDVTAGWRRVPPRAWHCGAQALLFPPAIARELVGDPDMIASCLAATTHVPIPELLSSWMARRRFDAWQASPSLTQHIGNTSTVWMNTGLLSGRRAPWYSGSIDDEPTLEESLSGFPEVAFPWSDEARDDSHDRIDTGRARMREASVVICGICRNARSFLPRIAASIERLGSCFAQYQVIIVEHDSIDATGEFLRDWSSSNDRVLIERHSMAPDAGRPLSSQLAALRNRYHQIVADRFARSDYVIVLDMDFAGGFSLEGVAHTFGQESWDAVGSYGLRRHARGNPRAEWPYEHYDGGAFRPASPAHPLARVRPATIRLERGGPLIPVASCFGGLAVYRREAFLSATYSGGDSEHVAFHEALRRAGFHRQSLNPSQIVLYPPG